MRLSIAIAVWSPDGRRIVFESNRKGARNLYMKPVGGGGSEDLLLESSQDKVAADWSGDGRFILYYSLDPQTDWDLWVLPMDGDRKPWPFVKTPFNERHGQFSPDRRWVAYVSNESGRTEIYVRPFLVPAAAGSTSNRASAGAVDDRSGGQLQVSTAGGLAPRWRPDGKELYDIGLNGQMMAAPITAAGTTLEPGTPVALFQTRIYGGGGDFGQAHQYDVARDSRFLINTVLDDATAPITLLQNWVATPKK